MGKFLAIIFAYMLSISSAFAATTATDNGESIFADIIASDQGMQASDFRIIIMKGGKELNAARSQGIRVVSMKIDTRNDNFMAVIARANNSTFEVKGKFEKIRQIPVLSRAFKKEEVITAADISYTGVEESKLRRGYITEASTLIGKVATRDIAANRPVMPSLIANEKVVLKGAMVTAIYKSDLLQLSDTVQAMEDGAIGESIRLKNTNSNKVIRGKVTAVNTVELTTLKQLASN